MINAVLIDDEKNALEMLEWQLQTYCSQLVVKATCSSAEEGIAAIQLHRPQLVFLDIEMPLKNGFEVLLFFKEPFFDVIFTTAYNQFAIKAFRFAAFDYLLKPVDADDLAASVLRYEKKMMQTDVKRQLELLMQQYNGPAQLPAKVSFSTQEAIHFIDPLNILYCESNSNYTTLYFANNQKLVVSKTLKEVEEVLMYYHFYRIHHSFIINLQHVKRYLKNDGGSIEMTNDAQLPISRQRKQEVIQVISFSIKKSPNA
ncbi:MAG: LytTR family DNA-binding domain-containing protein [Ginsengibacter sp.]